METLTDQNMNQAIVPCTLEQMAKDLPEIVDLLVQAQLGDQQVTNNDLPIWYVLTKASGCSGIPLEKLYNDPMARQHALAVTAADTESARRTLLAMKGKAESKKRGKR